MYGILQVNTLPSGNTMTFIKSCHKYPEIFIKMSQMYSTSDQVCQLIPNYIRAKYARMT